MSWELEKSKLEIRDYVAEMKDSWQRRNWMGRLKHYWVDIFVEAYRRMPYTLGHICAILLGADILLKIVSWVV